MRLRRCGLDEVLARQSGRYEVADACSAAGREAAVDVLCTGCVREPVWDGGQAEAPAIPCPEPCSMLVALCREVALAERDGTEPHPENPDLAYADFETPGNPIREAVLRRLAAKQAQSP